jgi:hypothetical protein
MLAFAEAYAEQNQRDYEAFMAAIASGRIEASHSEGAASPMEVGP